MFRSVPGFQRALFGAPERRVEVSRVLRIAVGASALGRETTSRPLWRLALAFGESESQLVQEADGFELETCGAPRDGVEPMRRTANERIAVRACAHQEAARSLPRTDLAAHGSSFSRTAAPEPFERPGCPGGRRESATSVEAPRHALRAGRGGRGRVGRSGQQTVTSEQAFKEPRAPGHAMSWASSSSAENSAGGSSGAAGVAGGFKIARCGGPRRPLFRNSTMP